MLGTPQTTPTPTVRSRALDNARGLAIAAMIVDHVTLIFHGPDVLRLTVGRVAMPLFFLIAGHLVRRLSWRHAGVYLLGLVLPVAIPWVDSPNVLEWYVLGAVAIVVARWADLPVWVYIAGVLAVMANGWNIAKPGTSYDGAALIALMLIGSQLPRSSWDWARRIPLGWLGRYPLTVYVGHLIVLQTVATLVA